MAFCGSIPCAFLALGSVFKFRSPVHDSIFTQSILRVHLKGSPICQVSLKRTQSDFKVCPPGPAGR